MKTCLLLLFFLVSLCTIAGNPYANHYFKTKANLEASMIYFEKGSMLVTEQRKIPIAESSYTTDTLSVNAFYLYAYEVSNQKYLDYLHYLKSLQSSDYEKALPDTLVWRSKMVLSEPYLEYYLRHPAYWDYPVVGVSYAQAVLFCDWLTKMYNEKQDRKFKKVIFRLPTKEEWKYAACYRNPEEKPKKMSGYMKRHGGILYDLSLFPWGTAALQNYEGQWLANFRPIDQASVRLVDGTLLLNGQPVNDQFYVGASYGDPVGIAGSLNDYSDLHVPVYSYWPNSMGLYNMAGNVEELVAEYGITKGGGWNDPGYYLRNDVEEIYDSTNETTAARGFRFVMEVVETFE